MTLRLENLDDRTRHFMLEELELDVTSGTLYLSPRLSESGRSEYESLLREAIKSGNDDSLAQALRSHNRMKLTEQRQKPKGVSRQRGYRRQHPTRLRRESLTVLMFVGSVA